MCGRVVAGIVGAEVVRDQKDIAAATFARNVAPVADVVNEQQPVTTGVPASGEEESTLPRSGRAPPSR